MNKTARIAIGSLALSAAGFISLTQHEGFTDKAVIPVTGDKPTVCFGMTLRPDGSPVQMGDKCTPVEGLKRTLAYVEKADSKLRECVKVPLHQTEFDLLDNHAYQYGVSATCGSEVVRRLNLSDYAGACNGYLEYRYMTAAKNLGPGWIEFKWDSGGKPVRWRFDCSTPGNKQCRGVWDRSVERFEKCLAVQ